MPSTGRERWQDEERLEARRASASRDAGLRRVSRLTGWAVAIAIGLTGLFSEVVAHALPGRSKGAAAGTSRAGSGSTTSAPAPSAVGSDQTLEAPDQQPSNPQPPEQAPAPSTASGGAVSGGS
jgi:hypothetical protein